MCFSDLLADGLAAKAWGIPIDEWWLKPRWARAFMVSVCDAEGTIEWVSMKSAEDS